MKDNDYLDKKEFLSGGCKLIAVVCMVLIAFFMVQATGAFIYNIIFVPQFFQQHSLSWALEHLIVMVSMLFITFLLFIYADRLAGLLTESEPGKVLETNNFSRALVYPALRLLGVVFFIVGFNDLVISGFVWRMNNDIMTYEHFQKLATPLLQIFFGLGLAIFSGRINRMLTGLGELDFNGWGLLSEENIPYVALGGALLLLLVLFLTS